MPEKKEIIGFASENNAIIENSAVQLIIEKELNYKQIIEEEVKKGAFLITKKMIEEKIIKESTKLPETIKE
jgi:hypothetical protein